MAVNPVPVKVRSTNGGLVVADIKIAEGYISPGDIALVGQKRTVSVFAHANEVGSPPFHGTPNLAKHLEIVPKEQ